MMRNLLLLFLLVLACITAVDKPGIVDPAQAPDQTWQRLKGLESFRFHLRYHTDTPFALGADFVGVWSAPDRESWTGHMWRGAEREKVTLIAAGDAQYERDRAGWHRSQRGLETQILEQAQQVLRGKQVSLLESEGMTYRYRFKPTLPVLDPARTKSFAGTMKIDSRSGLPVGISCSDPLGSAEWELVFDRFNRAGRVTVPFVPELELVIAPERRLGRKELNVAVVVLRKRLDELDWDYRLFRRWGKLVLQLDRKVARGWLELLLSAGNIEIWSAERVVDSTVTEDTRVLVVGGDASFRVTLGQKIGGNGDFDVSSKLGFLPEPKLLFAFRDSAGFRLDPGAGRLLVLAVNGDVLDCSRAIVELGVEFSGLSGKEFARIVAALANQAAMPAGFKVVSVR